MKLIVEYLIYKYFELNDSPIFPKNNFRITKVFIWYSQINKTNIQRKFICDGWIIVFDGTVLNSSGDEFIQNVLIFGVHNSLSRHSENCKSNFLTLNEGPTDNINNKVVEPEKKFSSIYFII